MSDYKIPPATRIGHVHLKVSSIEKSLDFYVGLLGFQIMARYGSQAVFISDGDYHHHIGLNTWHSENQPPASINHPGLYHVAILYPERKELAKILKRLIDHEYPLTGFSDHAVSEAIYLNDPDKNGIELYWDRPKDMWVFDPEGNIVMGNQALDIEDLLSTLD